MFIFWKAQLTYNSFIWQIRCRWQIRKSESTSLYCQCQYIFLNHNVLTASLFSFNVSSLIRFLLFIYIPEFSILTIPFMNKFEYKDLRILFYFVYSVHRSEEFDLKLNTDTTHWVSREIFSVDRQHSDMVDSAIQTMRSWNGP